MAEPVKWVRDTYAIMLNSRGEDSDTYEIALAGTESSVIDIKEDGVAGQDDLIVLESVTMSGNESAGDFGAALYVHPAGSSSPVLTSIRCLN